MRRTSACVGVIALTYLSVRGLAETQSAPPSRPFVQLLPLINDALANWTVENGPMTAVNVSNGTLIVTEQAGLVRNKRTCAPGLVLSFDVRLASRDARALLVLGMRGPMMPLRGYGLSLPSGTAPLHQDSGLNVLEIDPASMARIRKLPEDWSHYEIPCDADHVTVTVDDNRIVDEGRPGIVGGWFGVRADVGSVVLRNIYIDSNTLQFEPVLEFNTKGVEFGPWLRRFVAQVKRNWYVPYAPMSKGRVAITFNVHKDGSVTDVTIASPSSNEAYNRAAYSAVTALKVTLPLPTEYPDERAFFTVTFHYNEPARLSRF